MVERADVLPGKDLAWKAVPLYDAQHQSVVANTSLTSPPSHIVGTATFDKLLDAAQRYWPAIPPDIVDDRYVDYPLTLPLPPLVGRDWGPEVCHPDIPLYPPPLEQAAPEVPAQVPQQQPATTDVNSPFGSAGAGQPGPGGAPYPAPGRFSGEFPGAPGGRPSFRRFSPEMGPGGMGPGMSGPGARRFGTGPEGGASYRGGSGGTATQHTYLPPGVDFYLLRFFDYTVEPGKKYKYRVRLVLADPNYNMPAAELAPAVLDRQAKEAKAHNNQRLFFRTIETWSEPSPTVGIPMAGSVRLADVKIPSAEKFNDEPSATLLVQGFDVDDRGSAIQAAIEKKGFQRGYVANMVEDAEYLGGGGMYIDTQPDFKFLTGMTLLDIDGGTKLTRDMTVPARILLMGPAGELYIRNEIDDKPIVDYHRMLFEKPSNKHLGPGGGPEGSPGGYGRRRP